MGTSCPSNPRSVSGAICDKANTTSCQFISNPIVKRQSVINILSNLVDLKIIPPLMIANRCEHSHIITLLETALKTDNKVAEVYR